MRKDLTPTEFLEVLFTPDEVSSTEMLCVGRSSMAHCADGARLNQQPKAMSAPIVPHDNDVLMGRGGKNNQHIGNEKLRGLARSQCDNYRLSSKKGKSYISRDLVKIVRNMSPPGRFLKKNSITGLWDDVGDEVAREKASQALRDAVSAQMSNPKNASPEQLDQSMEAISQEHRRSSSDPCMSQSPKTRGKRGRNYNQNWRERPSPVYSSSTHRPVPAFSTPRDLPPVTPASVTSAKRRRYVPPTTPHEFTNLPVPGSPIQVSFPAPPPPRTRYPTQHSAAAPDFDSPGAILGEIQGESSDFDLFNGELLEVDEDPRGQDSPGLRSDTF